MLTDSLGFLGGARVLQCLLEFVAISHWAQRAKVSSCVQSTFWGCEGVWQEGGSCCARSTLPPLRWSLSSSSLTDTDPVAGEYLLRSCPAPPKLCESPPGSLDQAQDSKQDQDEVWQPLSPSGKDAINYRVTGSGSMAAGVTMRHFSAFAAPSGFIFWSWVPTHDQAVSWLQSLILPLGRSWDCFANRTFPTCLKGQQCVSVPISEQGGKAGKKPISAALFGHGIMRWYCV